MARLGALLGLLALLAAACGGGDTSGTADAGTTTPPRGDRAAAAPDPGPGEDGPAPAGTGADLPGEAGRSTGGPAPTGPDTAGTAADGSTATGSGGHDPSEEAATHRYVPPAGTYRYETSGFVESGSGPTRRRREPPPESVDEVTVIEQGDGVEVRTRTTYGSDSSQELVVLVQAGEAHLTRLAYGSTTAGVTSEQAVTPQPPILVARFPYVVGDRWESAWQDPSLGIQGVGWGAVLRSETVTTGVGPLDTVVLELHQRIRGSVTGDLTFTMWLDPSTGVLARQVVVTEMHDATGSSRSETTRVLREEPS